MYSTHTNITINWLKNAVIALAISGLYSVILVLLRTPLLYKLFPDKSVFSCALIIHVNLSILVFLCSISALFWSLTSSKTGFERILQALACFAILLIALSPAISNSIPVMNNYLPMLENILFILGLVSFGIVILFSAIQTLFANFHTISKTYGARLIKLYNSTSTIMIILVWLCFCLSYLSLKKLVLIVPLDLDFFYEMLYWSGGHLLQFIYTQLFMLSLLILAEAITNKPLKLILFYELLLALNFAFSLGILLGHYFFELEDSNFKEFFTLHMIYTGGVAPSLLIFALIFELYQARRQTINQALIKNPSKETYLFITFFSSIFLFLTGGLMGSYISGVNVTIPAHYHGVIVGITISLMGISYLICFNRTSSFSLPSQSIYYQLITYLPKQNLESNLFIGKISLSKAATWQISLIAAGQLLHISGLYLAGGYGVMRKNPGETVNLAAKFYMGLVGGGGLLAILGGLMFVLICANCLFFKKFNKFDEQIRQ